jgi:hypothetical protein
MAQAFSAGEWFAALLADATLDQSCARNQKMRVTNAPSGFGIRCSSGSDVRRDYLVRIRLHTAMAHCVET